MKNYRIICRRSGSCRYDGIKRMSAEEFDRIQYSGGFSCSKCGFPRCIIARSNGNLSDSFKPGFKRNILKHCATYAEYKAHLKNMGLVEIGYDEFPEATSDEKLGIWDDEMIKTVQDKGAGLSDRECQALKDETLLKDVYIDTISDSDIENDKRFKKGFEDHEREVSEKVKNEVAS